MAFIDVREPHTKKLLFRYDPARDIIEIQQRNVKTLVDLSQYKAGSIAGCPVVVDDHMPPNEIRFGPYRLRVQAPESAEGDRQ